jgi:hypothetical protein
MSTKATAKAEAAMSTDFTLFQKAVNRRFVEMSKHELYVVDLGDALFDAYLAAFPAEANPVIKERRLYDCNTCKQFVRRLGKVVTIKGGQVGTVWEGGLDLPEPFKSVAAALHDAVRDAKVVSVFRTKEGRYGQDHNYGQDGTRHDHFFGDVAARHRGEDADTQRGEQDAIFQVMTRGLAEIKEADLDTVLNLIDENQLYKGADFKPAVEGFKKLLRGHAAADIPYLYVWENLGHKQAKFRSTLIGNLLVELSKGTDVDAAVRAYEAQAAPQNYKRPTAVITQKMVDDALATLNKLDLGGAVHRRYLRLGDVSVNDVLFVDNESRSQMKDGLAVLLEASVKKTPPDLKRATPIAADAFVKDVLPKAKTLEAFVQNRHQGNFVALTTSDDSGRLFKWDNPAAWSYEGNVTDSVKQRVKSAGGKVDAKLRVSLSWFNFDDLDLHAETPTGEHIGFNEKRGVLDVDMNAHHGTTRSAVENLAFNALKDGVYRVWVNQFQKRESIDVGFAIEVEFGGQVHEYSYPKAVKDKENVQCFKLHVKKGELVKIETELAGGTSSQEKWGVQTETLVPVVAAMYSPNYWGENAVGAKHLILALKGCKNPGPTRGVYNEFLRADLEKHRKVFEVLGAKTQCPYSDEQVSGVGFTAARGDTVTLVVDGKRAYLLTF